MWLVEQPQGSLLEAHPRWQWLLGHIKAFRVFIWMQDFGHQRPKPTWIYSNMHWVGELVKYRMKDSRGCGKPAHAMVKKTAGSSGKRRVTGLSDKLKESQSYPQVVGEAARKLYSSREHELKAVARQLVPTTLGYKPLLGASSPADAWDDAGAPRLLQYIHSG